jgi:hypothetical protein
MKRRAILPASQTKRLRRGVFRAVFVWIALLMSVASHAQQVSVSPTVRADPNSRPRTGKARDDASWTRGATIRVRGDKRVVGNAVVMKDGTVVGVMGVTGKASTGPDTLSVYARIVALQSGDSGRTFRESATIAPWTIPKAARPMPPQLAVDRSNGSLSDRVYCAWTDRGASGSQILLSYYDDAMRRWSEPVVVSHRASRTPNLELSGSDEPVIAVNGNGVVGVIWRAAEAGGKGRDPHLRFAASLDGGDSFTESVRVSYQRSPTSADEETTPRQSAAPSALSIDPDSNGSFRVTWTADHGEDVLWTSSVTVTGVAAKNGSAALSKLADLTRLVSWQTSNVRVDRKSGVATMDLTVRNLSSIILSGPLYLRIISATSDVDQVEITNADNGVHGPGAVWNLEPTLPRRGLKPGERSSPKRLTFKLVRLSGVGASSLRASREAFVELHGRILGAPIRMPFATRR